MIVNIIIINSSLTSLICAHHILDNLPKAKLHLLTEEAEIGLLNEAPGLLNSRIDELIPEGWIHNLRNQQPSEDSTAVRRSWLERGIASKLAERGATIHLRTTHQRESKEYEEFIHLTGAGAQSGSTIKVDQYLKLEQNGNQQIWKGGVHNGGLSGSEFEGCRPDGTIEIWWLEEDEEPQIDGSWLQLTEWRGSDPQRALEIAFHDGIDLAASIL